MADKEFEAEEIQDETAAPPAPAPVPVARPARGATGRLRGATRSSKSMTASVTGKVQYDETGKPIQPKKKGGFIKLFFILLCFVAIPGLVIGGFFVKNYKNHNVWHELCIKCGLITDNWVKPVKKGPDRTPFDLMLMDIRNHEKLIEILITIDVRRITEKIADESLPENKQQVKVEDRVKPKELEALIDSLKNWQNTLPGDIDNMGKIVEELAKPEGTTAFTVGVTNTEADASLKKLQECLSDIRKRRLHWETVLAERTGTAPKPPPIPPPAAFDARKVNPLFALKVGQWWRTRTVKKAGDTETVTWKDMIVTATTDDAITLKIVQPGAQETETTSRFIDGTAKVSPEDEKLTFTAFDEEGKSQGERTLMARLVEITNEGQTTRMWVCREGPGTNIIALKIEAVTYSLIVTKLDAQDLQIHGQNWAGVHYHARLKSGETESGFCAHYAASLPGTIVRRAMQGTVEELADWGDAGKTRPEFPADEPPKEPPKDPPKDPPMDPPKDPPAEPPKDPPKDPPADPPKAPPKDPPP